MLSKRVAYRLTADAVVVAHGLFILFVLGGGFLTWRWRWVVWLHLPTALYGALVEFVGWTCPLTPLENMLRRQAGEAGYPGSFVEHYLLPVIYPAALTHRVQLVLGAVVVLVNVAAYVGYAFRKRSP